MIPLDLGTHARPLRVLCLGAHSDDIEIGCGGTLMHWLHSRAAVEVTWVVLSAAGERAGEARRSARALLRGAARAQILLGDFEDAHFPAQFRALKTFLADLRDRGEVDVVLTHHLADRHQDHRTVAELSWQHWRDHLILEYEIAKVEGDLGQPNLYVPLPARIAARKVDHLMKHFATQRSKAWFDERNFQALMRLRGLECRAESGLAEAFHARKLILGTPGGRA